MAMNTLDANQIEEVLIPIHAELEDHANLELPEEASSLERILQGAIERAAESLKCFMDHLDGPLPEDK